MLDTDDEIIKETERRWKRREQERDQNIDRLKAFRDDALRLDEVDDPNIIENRLRRVLDRGRPDIPTMTGGLESLIDRTDVRPRPTLPPIRELTRIGLERIMGADDLLRAGFLYAGAEAAQAVGRVVVRSSRGTARGFGTGFLIAPEVLMTNWHVLETAEDARFAVIQFGYYELPDGRMGRPLEFQLMPDRLYASDRGLDYAVVAVSALDVNGAVESKTLGWHTLDRSPTQVMLGDRLNLLQHPHGGGQRCALRDNELVDRIDDFYHYHSDTERGSSGSPVFNDQWEVVALHHSGVPRKDENGNYLRVDGDIWDRNVHHIDDLAFVANEGIRIERIVAHLEGRLASLTPEAKKRLQTVLSPTQPERLATRNLLDRLRRQGRPTTEDQPVDPGLFPPPLPPLPPAPTIGGTYSVPLTIAVADSRVVSVAVGEVGRPPPTDPVTPIPPTPIPVPPIPPVRPEPVDPIMIDGRRYYDGTADAEKRDRYWAEAPSSGDLFDYVSKRLSDTHDKVFSYSVARYDHLYKWVDLHEDGKLHSLYSGTSFTSEEMMRLDQAVELARTRRLQEQLTLEGFASGAELEAFEDLLENSLPYNCEHVVPQSWFSKRSPMKTDLHHLFACESGCNSFRGNLYFYDFPPELEAVREGCGQRLDRRFEPMEGKGAVARATLYFLLRYPGEIDDLANEMPEDALATLMGWHERYAVSSWEKHRNSAIAAAQGNRNPLIDHPQWLERIDFKRGFG